MHGTEIMTHFIHDYTAWRSSDLLSTASTVVCTEYTLQSCLTYEVSRVSTMRAIHRHAMPTCCIDLVHRNLSCATCVPAPHAFRSAMSKQYLNFPRKILHKLEITLDPILRIALSSIPLPNVSKARSTVRI